MNFLINNISRVLLAVTVIAMTGCMPRNIIYPRLPDLQNPAGYIQEIMTASEQLTDVSGMAKLSMSVPQGTLNSKNIFLVKRPSFIRIEVLGFLSRPSLFFLTDGAIIHLYDSSDNTFYTGEATADNIHKIIWLELTPQDIVQLFLGFPPIINPENTHIVCRQEKKYYSFTLRDKTRTYLLLVDPSLKRVVQYQLFDDVRPICKISFSNFVSVQGRMFPLQAEMHHYPYQSKIEVSYESLNAAPVASDMFRFTPPLQALRLPLEDFFKKNK